MIDLHALASFDQARMEEEMEAEPTVEREIALRAALLALPEILQSATAGVSGADVYERALRQLASPYGDHADYRPEWDLDALAQEREIP